LCAGHLTFTGCPDRISWFCCRTNIGRLRETHVSGYALDNSWDRAKRRLALLEHFLDPKTKRHMQALGVARGWNCLEIAAGGGSIARWLSETVGDSGNVMATDINTALLKELSAPNLETREHNILTEDLPEAAFDIVHCREKAGRRRINHEHIASPLVGDADPGASRRGLDCFAALAMAAEALEHLFCHIAQGARANIELPMFSKQF
jgi:ubiE/COQ5 methyltransferase family